MWLQAGLQWQYLLLQPASFEFMWGTLTKLFHVTRRSRVVEMQDKTAYIHSCGPAFPRLRVHREDFSAPDCPF